MWSWSDGGTPLKLEGETPESHQEEFAADAWAAKAGCWFLIAMIPAFAIGRFLPVGVALFLGVLPAVPFAYGMYRSFKHIGRQIRLEQAYRAEHGIRHKRGFVNWAFYDHPALAPWLFMLLVMAGILGLAALSW